MQMFGAILHVLLHFEPTVPIACTVFSCNIACCMNMPVSNSRQVKSHTKLFHVGFGFTPGQVCLLTKYSALNTNIPSNFKKLSL